MTDSILEFVVLHYRSLAYRLCGDDEAAANEAIAFDRMVRAQFGARWNYVPGEDKLERNRRVLAIYDQAVRDNAAQRHPDTPKQVKDRVCGMAGVKRGTLDNILAGRVARQHLP